MIKSLKISEKGVYYYSQNRNEKKGLFYMKKKALLILLSAVLTCGALAGCGSKEEPAAPVVTDISKEEEKK